MADAVPEGVGAISKAAESPGGEGAVSRREKRKALKKQKRKQIRKEAAVKVREEEEALANDPEEQLRARLREQEQAEAAERERREFEERERLWLEAAARRKAQEEEEEARRKKLLEELRQNKTEEKNESDDGDDWEYVEEGPAEIIWKENEIIVKKKRVKVPKKAVINQRSNNEDQDRPTSNPLPPQSTAFAAFKSTQSLSAQELLESVAQQTPNFGTEQDKAHCPFHLKTGTCRFGPRCSRVHFYPDKSCTLLIKNMYNGPGLAWEQDEGLEYTDEEIERWYEEFYEDVHTEFLKFGEIVNFKVCRNGSFHLRGNVYVHYKSLESALLAYNSMNGRYFAGKQITCEFIGVTRWKVAICGEFMKSRLKTCSHGTACNFIHCFRNPGGDYEWADWENHPPKHWVEKMAVLFGSSDELEYQKHLELEDREWPENSGRKKTQESNRSYSRKSRHRERDFLEIGCEKDELDGFKSQHSSRSSRRKHSSKSRKQGNSCNEWEKYEERHSHFDDMYISHHHISRETFSKRSGSLEAEDNTKDVDPGNHEKHDRKYRKSNTSNRTRVKIFPDEERKPESMPEYHERHRRRHKSPDLNTDRGYSDDFDRENEDKSGKQNVRYRSVSPGKSSGDQKNSTSSGYKKAPIDLIHDENAHGHSRTKLDESENSSGNSGNTQYAQGMKYKSSHSKDEHHRKNREYESAEQEDGNPGIDDHYSRNMTSRKHSRSGTPTRHASGSRKERKCHGNHD